MKKINSIFWNTLILCSVILISLSCNEDEVLREQPESFLSPQNAFNDIDGFEAAIGELHRLSRALYTTEEVQKVGNGIEADKTLTTVYANGTDLSWFVVISQNQFTNYALINSTNQMVTGYWNLLFKIIANSNTVLANIVLSDIDNADKLRIEANAKFFRAYAYRFLVYLYGDVPIIREELNAPKLDFIRDPVNDVLSFMREDLQFASQNLPVINSGDGQLSKAAADHILAETFISLGQYDEAIASASKVIDDPQYELMTERFGSSINMPGDVFWDLFRTDNQNRTSGNTESIWVWQLDFVIPNGNPVNPLTRSWAPLLERLRDSKGVVAHVPADTLGRGVGFVKPTKYLDSLIWESDFNNDIRNSKFNMQRRFVNNNPASEEFGQLIEPTPTDLDRNHYVFVKKAASPEGYVQGYDRSGRLYTDIYAIRLSETYLLRAEAYLKNGNPTSAANDINVVRSRAKANPVAASDVDIDYILDERARELVVEEPRRLTLARMDKLVERVRKYNPVSAPSIQEFHDLWPIPQNEIDANIEATLEQNPGY